MKIFVLLLLFVALNAEIIDGVAIKVNGNIITLYEIEEAQKNLNLERKAAIETLINEKLKENEIKKLGIKINEQRISEEMENIAAANQITLSELKEALKSQGVDFETYKKELREHIINRELMQKVLQTNPNVASESDLRQYYDTNKNEFMIPMKIKVTSYVSNSDVELRRFLQNPMVVNPNIEMKDEEIDIRNLPQQIAGIFLNTKEKQFTPVLNSGNTLIVFFIKEKLDKELLSFDDAKSIIMQKYAQSREEIILNDYFSKIKANTKIEIIRQ